VLHIYDISRLRVKLIICFWIDNISTFRGLALTRNNISGMIPLQHDEEEVRKLVHSATIVPVRFATVLMFHTVCGFLVHQQKLCNWCIIPFALDYRAVTKIRGKHRLSGASNLHFPAYIRGWSMIGTAQAQGKNANRHARRNACKPLCKMGVRFVRSKWKLKLRDIFWYQMSQKLV